MSDLPSTVCTADLAMLLGITPNRVNALAREGAIPKAGRGRFPIPQATQAYVAWQKENPAGRRVKDPEQADAKTRLTAAQAELAETKLAQARGDLLDAGEVEREWTAALVDRRAALLALPARLQTDCGLTADTTRALDREITDALMRLAEVANP